MLSEHETLKQSGHVMLKDKAAIIYREKLHLNCAEAMLHAADEVYDFELDAKALATMTPFGGGMGVGSVCGSLTGGLAALGVLIKDDESLDKADKAKLSAEFYQQFKDKLGSEYCADIKGQQWDPKRRCESTVAISAELLNEFVQNYQKK